MTRRNAVGLLLRWMPFLANGTALLRAAASESEVDRIVKAAGPPARVYHRCYKVHAGITLFSVQIASRQDVGGAFATVEEFTGPNGGATTALQFSSGSFPDRARGLNRFGAMQEAAVLRGASLLEAATFGFMTSTREKTFDQARRALDEKPDSQIIALTHGVSAGGVSKFRLKRFPLPSRYQWSDAAGILDAAHAQSEPPSDSVPVSSDAPAYPSLLYGIRRAILAPSKTMEQFFLHNAEQHVLRTEKGNDLGKDGLASMRVITHQRNGSSNSESKVWFDPKDPGGIPLRIEFRPKFFLRLTFEANTAMVGPNSRPALISDQNRPSSNASTLPAG